MRLDSERYLFCNPQSHYGEASMNPQNNSLLCWGEMNVAVATVLTLCSQHVIANVFTRSPVDSVLEVLNYDRERGHELPFSDGRMVVGSGRVAWDREGGV